MQIEAFLDGIKSADVRAVARHWFEVRGSRRMPGWSDIRPSRIAAQLSFVWAYSYDAATDSFIGRLAGDRIEAIFGKSFRHTPLSEVFPPEQYEDVFRRAKRVIEEPAIFYGGGLVFHQLARYGTGERVILPLAGDGIRSDGLLGCTEYHAAESSVPRPQTSAWFAL